ncbi:MAG: MFS transporter [Candidatus Parcubacteria bacterium]|nr:MFS transporter [Candidatus Parcubacteria bacterium]
MCDTSKICCKKVAAATPAAGATCTSKATAAIPAKTGKCQAAACTGDTKIEADPKCSDAKTPNCCATAAAPKATCKDAGGTCKAKESSGKCPGEETEVTDLKTKCDKPNGGGDTTKNTCCKAASATAGDQSGAAGGTAGAGTDPFSRIFNVFIACLTFSISLIIHLAAWLAGQIVVLLMEILVFISGYNSFIRNSYVSEGWRILRDLVNMFFVLGMLFIAFATVLKIEKYSWNKLLGKLLMMAVLVNFSKTICGVIIDFFQVLLMTFANAYKDITAGNIFSGLGMVDWFKVQSQAVAGNVAAGVQLGMIASAFLGLILAIVSMIVIFIFCVILIVRIVGLWVLVTFSPLAFFAYTFEGTKGLGTISSTWWKEFLEYCMVGPFVGFILWISVATLPKLDVNQMIPGNWYDTSKREGLQVTFSEAGSMDRILKYMMSIVTMVVGLGYAKKFSIIGASALSGVAEKFKDQTVGRAQRFGKSAGETISAPVRGAMKGVGDAMRGNRYMRYMTTEGRKEAAQLSEAKARGAFGPRSGEQERMMRQITEGDVKRLDSERAFINPNAFKGKLKEAFDKGDYRNARALMNEGAKKGWIGTDDVDKFKDQFRPKMGEKAHFEFTEQLGKDFKEATGRHLRTNDEYISPEGKVLAKTDTAEKEYKDAVGRMSASQQSDMAENKKVFKNEDGNNKYWKEDIMAFTGNEMNAGRWTQKARNNIRDGIDEIRKDPNKMKEFNKEQLQDMNVLYEAATAEYEGLNRAKDADGNKSKGKVAFDHGSLRIDKDRGINLAAKDGYESADIAGAPRISDDDINNLKQKEKEEENKTPKVTGAPPAPRSSILSGLAKSKYFGKEGEDAVLAWKGKPVTRAAEAGANYARRAYKFMTNVGGKRGDVGYVPPKAKELGGAENLSAADIKVIIDQEKEMGKDLSFGANNVRMTDNGDFLASERTKILADIQQKLQAKGLGADVAANKAGQIVRNREDQFRHQQASREVHLKVLQNIEMEGTNTPTKLVGLESVQDETAAGAIDSKSIEQAIFDVTSRFNKYVKQLGKSGADIDQNGVAGMQQELDKLTNYARTRKDLSSKEKLDAINNINVTVKVMKDGILVEGVPEK